MENKAELKEKIDFFCENFIKKISIDITEKSKVSFISIVKDYLLYTADNIIELQTYYFRNPVNFYKYYYPLESYRGKDCLKFVKPAEELQKFKFSLIEGGAGFGKTTLLRYCFLQAIKEVKKIPILIPLRDLNDIDIKKFFSLSSERLYEIDYSTEKIVNSSDKQSINIIYGLFRQKFFNRRKPDDDEINILTQMLKSGLFIFLLDGYDEIIYSNQNKILSDINSFYWTNSENNIVITSRPNSSIYSLSSLKRFSVSKLSNEDINNFIIKIKGKGKFSNSITEALNHKKSKFYRDLLRNPLLLSFFILTFEDYPEIPTKRKDLYYNVFQVLHSKHKARQGITNIPRRTNLSQSEFIQALSVISYSSYMNGKYELSENYLSKLISEELNSYGKIKTPFKEEDLFYDLVHSISILVQDGSQIFYLHRSIQEYYTAEFIGSLDFEKEKIKAYERLTDEKVLSEKADDLTNLLDLLMEVDPIGVKSFLLLNSLENFINFSEEFGEYRTIDFIETCQFDANIRINSDNENLLLVELTMRENKLVSLLNYFGYHLTLTNIIDNIEKSELETDLAHIISSDPELISEINYNSYSLLELIDISVDLKNCVFEHFDRLDIENDVLKTVQKDVQKLKDEIENFSLGLDSIITG